MPSPGSLLLALALLVIVGIFVLRPLLAPAPAVTRRTPGRREALESEKEALLARIRVLDFDHETGTLPDEDHARLRQRLVAAAANVLRELDALEAASPAASASPAATASPAPAFSTEPDEIEVAISRRRQRAAADIEAAIAQRRARPQPEAIAVAGAGNGSGAASRLFCPQCGQEAVRGDRFCAYCGRQLD